ncbi:hypothetical protein BCR39DRAFT_499043 [Naematelia encephala]|uniref:DUF7598 domain-containing protein n=1 Tax=Naematelia encephala TaxID=71784 RepID=A0A1Y2AUP9_9TREE|nr:hypothetical protein BCR39DRAFT_499043 [Naematelia encephala]
MSESIKPFLPARPSGPVFIALNALRLMSIVSLLLVMAANIKTMVDDIKAIKADSKLSDNDTWDCDYVEYSTVPDQTGGAFWSILNRLFIIFECILLTLSEIGVPKRFLEEFVPVLGPAHGLGCLGVFQALIGAQVLSHYCDLFPQVTAWLLFIVGCLNIVAGLMFRHKSKTRRLIFSWENVSSLTPQTRMAATAWDMVTEKKPAPSTTTAQRPQEQSATNNSPPLSRTPSQHSDSPLLPQNSTAPGARFGGFGFGRQGERAAADRGFKISRPLESLPRYAF